jgi:hypothetical protein
MAIVIVILTRGSPGHESTDAKLAVSNGEVVALEDAVKPLA